MTLFAGGIFTPKVAETTDHQPAAMVSPAANVCCAPRMTVGSIVSSLISTASTAIAVADKAVADTVAVAGTLVPRVNLYRGRGWRSQTAKDDAGTASSHARSSAMTETC